MSVNWLAVFVLSLLLVSLRGVTIPNDGYVLASDIGFGDTGLHCNTDRSGCCTSGDHPSGAAQGHWYYPNGTQVGSFSEEDAASTDRNFFYRNRATGIVRLNRAGDPPQRARFRCEIPNAGGALVNLYVNIGECFVSQIIRELLYTPLPYFLFFLVDVIPTPPPITAAPTTVTVSPITSSGSATACSCVRTCELCLSLFSSGYYDTSYTSGSTNRAYDQSGSSSNNCYTNYPNCLLHHFFWYIVPLHVHVAVYTVTCKLCLSFFSSGYDTGCTSILIVILHVHTCALNFVHVYTRMCVYMYNVPVSMIMLHYSSHLATSCHCHCLSDHFFW